MKAFRYDGRPIAVPGAWAGVDIAHYHSGALCIGPSVSSSGLKRAAKTPAHFYAYSPWNPDCEAAEDTTALRLGKVAHVLALEPERFRTICAVSPYDDYRTKEAREWRDATVDSGLIPLKAAELLPLQRMADALRKHPDALALFRNGLPELTFAAKDEATGIWMLSRPDFVPGDPGRGLVDYKTATDAGPEAFGAAAFNYGYHMQVALALDVVAAATGELRPTCWHVVQEKEPPFAVAVYRYEADQVMYGRREVRRLLDLLARCRDAGEWPGYGEPQSIVTPFWARKEMEANGYATAA